MKKTYIEPSINIIHINCTQMLALSGGGYGESGDAAESKRFEGNFLEEEDTNKSWY